MLKNKTDSKQRRWNSHILLRGMEHGTTTSLAVSYKVIHTLIMWPGGPTTWYLPNWNENQYSYKNLYVNVAYSGLLPQTENNNEKLPRNKKKLLMYTITWMKLKYIILNKKSQTQRLHTVQSYDIHIKAGL